MKASVPPVPEMTLFDRRDSPTLFELFELELVAPTRVVEFLTLGRFGGEAEDGVVAQEFASLRALRPPQPISKTTSYSQAPQHPPEELFALVIWIAGRWVLPRQAKLL